MAKEPDAPAVNWMGVKIETWLVLVQKVGFSTIFVCFLCVVAYQMLPPLAKGHLDHLRRTGDTMDTMSQTLKESNKILEEIMITERRSEAFMGDVHEEHVQALEDHQEILKTIREGQ